MNFKLTTIIRIFLITLLIGFFAFASILLGFAYSNNFRTWSIENIVNTKNLQLDIKGKTMLEIGWQPKLTLNNISITNAAGPKPGNVAQIGQLSFQISIPKLFHGDIFFNDVSISKPELSLFKNKKGDVNWSFSDQKADSNAVEIPVIFENLRIISGKFNYYEESGI